MKVRVKVRPSGLLNQQPWPEEGELVDLPDAIAEDMIAAGTVEKAKAEKPKTEKRPAPDGDVETRTKKK